jgi:hypothetical protein
LLLLLHLLLLLCICMLHIYGIIVVCMHALLCALGGMSDEYGRRGTVDRGVRSERRGATTTR